MFLRDVDKKTVEGKGEKIIFCRRLAHAFLLSWNSTNRTLSLILAVFMYLVMTENLQEKKEKG